MIAVQVQVTNDQAAAFAPELDEMRERIVAKLAKKGNTATQEEKLTRALFVTGAVLAHLRRQLHTVGLSSVRATP